MLHYSNASSIEKNRRYLVIKGGLAWLLWQGGVVNTRSFDEMITIDLVETTLTIRLQTCNDVVP